MKLHPFMKDFGFVHCHPKNVHRMTQNRELYAVLKENNNFTFHIEPDVVCPLYSCAIRLCNSG